MFLCYHEIQKETHKKLNYSKKNCHATESDNDQMWTELRALLSVCLSVLLSVTLSIYCRRPLCTVAPIQALPLPVTSRLSGLSDIEHEWKLLSCSLSSQLSLSIVAGLYKRPIIPTSPDCFDWTSPMAVPQQLATDSTAGAYIGYVAQT